VTTVLIGADICPIEGNSPYFQRGDAASLFSDLLPELEKADLTIANLECPLIEKKTPIQKTGPTFGEPSSCINGIKKAGFDLLCLANNHSMDHGAEGLLNTMRVCEANGIEVVGAGKNLFDARRIVIKKVNEVRIGILAMAEREFSIAGKDSPGANPLDLIDFVRNVNENRTAFDYLIVLFHGGDEFLVPSPRIKNICHFLVEIGANAVLVQHPHCVGGIEQYRNAHIVYGQGALVMDEGIYRRSKSFHEGFLVKLLIGAGGGAGLEIIPFVQSDPVPGARRLSADREKQFRQGLAEKSETVKSDESVEAQWLSFCEANKHAYLSALLGHNRILRRLNKEGMLSKLFYNSRVLLTCQNIVSCETHREAIDTIFRLDRD
jgi:poly-gamma-glutamate capsule biosynthesis protein CapA/YwtB (metallophosphatase superfamily)